MSSPYNGSLLNIKILGCPFVKMMRGPRDHPKLSYLITCSGLDVVCIRTWVSFLFNIRAMVLVQILL